MGEAENVRVYLPSYWNDDKRIQSLFAEFRNKELNPTGWQSKMNAWIDLIHSFSRSEKLAVVSVSDICTGFKRNKKLPACIDEVFNYMHRQNIIKTVDEYVCNEKCKTWFGWSYYSFIEHPLSYAWSFLRGMLFLPTSPQRFILIEVLKEMADSIFEKHEENKISSNVDNIVLLKEFRKQCTDICSGDDFLYVLMQLQQENKVKVFTEPDGLQVIKFRGNEKDDLEFTEVDKSIFRLKNAMDQNSQKLVELEDELSKCIIQARQCLKERSKEKALIVMRKKKRLEIEIQKKYSVQENLETLFTKVRNCNSEKKIVDALKTGAAALKNYFNTDLTLKDVDDTMEEVRETIDEFEEIQRSISECVDSEDNNLAEFEDELSEILKTEVTLPDTPEANAYHTRGTYGMADDVAPPSEVPSGSAGNTSNVGLHKRSTKKAREAEAAM